MHDSSDTRLFLRQHLIQILAFGWRGYQAGGRGAVFIHLVLSVTVPTADHALAHPMAYLQESQLALKIAPWEEPALEMLGRYDPERQVVVLLYDGSKVEIMLIASPHMTPPRADLEMRDAIPVLDPAIVDALLVPSK